MKARLRKAEAAVYKLFEGDRLHNPAEYIISVVICLNVVLIVFESIERDSRYDSIINGLRMSFFIFFLFEYIMRVWIADITLHDRKHPIKSRIRYMMSFRAIVDLLALLPVMLGSTIIDFRVFRILRLLKITQLKALRRYTDILTKVFMLKGAQLLSSLFIVLIFMLVSAVIIYDLENRAQPDVFNNILSGLWWTITAVTTVGYGDMYPITPVGRIFGSFMSIFGIFLMAIPIGILTSGFFEISKNVDSKERKE